MNAALKADAPSKTDDEFWASYNAYLRSPIWLQKRELVLKRCGYQCQGCGTARATQAHHLTYKHVFRELLFELVGLCDACHHIAHDDKATDEPLWKPLAEGESAMERLQRRYPSSFPLPDKLKLGRFKRGEIVSSAQDEAPE